MRPHLLLAALLAAAIGTARAQTPPDVVVFCDPGLCPALRAAGDLWRLGTRVPVRLFEFPTALMPARVGHGARVDLLAALDPSVLDAAEHVGTVRAGTRRTLGRDRLLLVRRAGGGAADGPVAVQDAGLPGPAAESRALLAAAGLLDLAVGAENTPAVAALVAEGQVPRGVVLATDLRADLRLEAVPGGEDAPTLTAEVVTARDARSPNAEAFRDYLLGPRGREALRAAGIEPLGVAPMGVAP